MFNSVIKKILIFNFGGIGYCLIELLWRRHTHWSMYLAGGLCLSIIEKINRTRLSGKTLWSKCAAGATVITAVEFICGCIVNLWMNLDVWDYTRLPMNLLGQVCLVYSALWYALSAPIILLSHTIDRRFRMGTEI